MGPAAMMQSIIGIMFDLAIDTSRSLPSYYGQPGASWYWWRYYWIRTLTITQDGLLLASQYWAAQLSFSLTTLPPSKFRAGMPDNHIALHFWMNWLLNFLID